jgi:hypothetical protein
MSTIFAAIPVGSYFECNGNVCRKQSTRTARLVDYDRVFYFSAAERVLLRCGT